LLERIFGPKKEEVVGEWRRLHNEKLHNLFASPNITMVIESRRIRLVRKVARIREMRNAYTILVRKSERKRKFGRPTSRGEEYIY
jgi:hypothetical protein